MQQSGNSATALRPETPSVLNRAGNSAGGISAYTARSTRGNTVSNHGINGNPGPVRFKGKPFLSRDVFHLLVRLEAQKTNVVDTNLLERRFRVPPGYAKDESLEQRERAARSATPGPGAYETSGQWPLLAASGSAASAVFASSVPRDAFHQVSSCASPTSAARTKGHTYPSSAATTTACLDPPPALGSFARSDRGLDPEPASYLRGAPGSPPRASHCIIAPVSNMRPATSIGGAIDRAPRALTDVASDDHRVLLGPGTYDTCGSASAPTPAVFSASTESREIMWSPARCLPTNARSDAWNSSRHYAKQKHRVERMFQKLQLQLQQDTQLGNEDQPSLSSSSRQYQHQHLRATGDSRLTASQSAPALVPASSPTKKARIKGTTRNKYDRRANGNSSTDMEPIDPFEWLRHLPQGERRVNALASKHGLVDQVRPLSPRAVASMNDPSLSLSKSATPLHDISELQITVHSHAEEPDLDHTDADGTTQIHATARSSGSSVGDDTMDRHRLTIARTGRSREVRIAVSGRLPGGCMVTTSVFASRTVRQFKRTLVRKQTRFMNEDSFDVFLPTGQRLAQLDATLEHYGIQDRALVLLVPVNR